MKRWTAALLAFAVAGCLAWTSAAFYFHQSFYEASDLAANALSIGRARHFAQLYGCYSRWGFYHPGPALFYVQAGGEWLFHDFLHLCQRPLNAQQLTQLCLGTTFFAAALRAFTLWLPAGPRRGRFLALALAFAAFHFADDRSSSFYDSWPAFPPVLLLLGLLATGAAVAAGAGEELPFVILAGGFLLHSHVAQPLFVLPLTALAYAGSLQRCAATRAKPDALPWWRRPGRLLADHWRAYPRAHLLSVGLIVVFAVPLVIDACRGTDSNLAAILAHLRAHRGEHKAWLRSAFYFLQFGTYAYYAGPGRQDFGHYDAAGALAYLRAHGVILTYWSGVASVATWVVIRQIPRALRKRAAAGWTEDPDESSTTRDTRRFLAWAGVFLGVVTGLTLYWGTIQDGPLLYYNAFFNWGIFYFAALIAFATICSGSFLAWCAAAARLTARGGWAAPALLALAVYAARREHFVIGPPPGDTVEIYWGVAKVAAATTPTAGGGPPTPKILLFDHDEWPWITAAALELARTKIPFLVPEEYAVMFGAEHSWHPRSGNPLKHGMQIWRFQHAPAPATSPSVVPTVLLDPRPPVYLSVTAPAIDPNQPDEAGTIDYRAKGNAREYLLSGWSVTEAGGTWSDAPRAMLAFSPKAVRGGKVELHMDLNPMLNAPGGMTSQRMRVYLNGELLGGERRLDATEATAGQRRFDIPAEAWNQDARHPFDCAVLEFEFPDAASPASMDPTGANLDGRLLGMLFVTLRFRAVPPPGGVPSGEGRP